MMKSGASNIELSYKRYVINAFVVFFLFSTIIWNLPKSRLRTVLLKPVRRAMVLLGMEQNFVTFAPNPPTRETSLHAVITYDDGTAAAWNFPASGRSNSVAGYFALSHFRAYWGHYLRSRLEKCQDLTAYILRDSGALNSADGKRKPVSVQVFVRSEKASVLDPRSGEIQMPKRAPDKIVYVQKINSLGVAQ